jgi:hypothetical protein
VAKWEDAMIEEVEAQVNDTVLRYAVLQSGDEWRIFCQRRRMGHFQTRDLALAAGSRLAREAHDAGHDVEFLVQEPSGELLRQDYDHWASRPRSDEEGYRQAV